MRAVVCLLASVTVSASDDPDGDISRLPLEQLLKVEIDNVVGASRDVQDIRLAPSSVTVLSREDILESGYRTLGDVLRTVRGLSVRDDHNYEYLGVRGFDHPGDLHAGNAT